jgi:hypothetical protein
MSAIDKLVQMALGNMIKELPPEVQKHLSPEGMKQLGERVAQTLDFFVNSQMALLEQNKAILDNQRIIMEAQGCDDRHNPGPIVKRGGNSDDNSSGNAGAIAA